jgi:hypothetical protein
MVAQYVGKHPYLFIHEITVLVDGSLILRSYDPQCEGVPKYVNIFVKGDEIITKSLAFKTFLENAERK